MSSGLGICISLFSMFSLCKKKYVGIKFIRWVINELRILTTGGIFMIEM